MKKLFTIIFSLTVFSYVSFSQECPPKANVGNASDRVFLIFDVPGATDPAGDATAFYDASGGFNSTVTIGGVTGILRRVFNNVNRLRIDINIGPPGAFTGSITTGAGTCTYDDGDLTVSALPVTLISFDAKANQREVMLDWSTASEQDNSHFEIERSTDGNSFRAIGTVAGAGNTNEVVKYTFADAVQSTTTYYRLKQVDFDGAFEYSKIVTVSTEKGGNISIAPNPVQKELSIRNLPAVNLTVQVFNAVGQVVYQTQQTGADQILVNLPNLPKGFYVLSIRDTDSLAPIHQEQLIKQ